MTEQIEVPPEALAAEVRDGALHEIAPDLAYQRLAIVNAVFIGYRDAGDRGWVLVDAGLRGTASFLRRAADHRFGAGARPRSIVLTHGHFDHVGALAELAEAWDAPIYAHTLERPYLDGSAAYPAADPSVGGGLMARLSPFYSTAPIDVSRRLLDLPEDGSVPPLPGWTALHTPGHAAGHISLWRGADRSLVAGDAFVTTAQESAYAVALQVPEIHGPPRYLTPDWQAARQSVLSLAALSPERAITGHGRAMAGPAFRAGLQRLGAQFEAVAVPRQGRYFGRPARPGDGSAYPAPSSRPSSKSEAPSGYPPFDTPKPVAADVWIVDAAPIRAGGLSLPLRMTVIRLPDGTLLLHSPTAYRRDLQDALEALGPIRHLVAPGYGHWMFLHGWQKACPEATTWAVAGLRHRRAVREAHLHIDAELGGDPPAAWGGALDLVPIRGPGFAEVELFHRSSRTLLLTDLVLNVEAPRLPSWSGAAARMLGIQAPGGQAPLYLRAILGLNRTRVAAAAARLLAFDPDRVIIAHGHWYEEHGRAQLEASLRWLLGPPRRISTGMLALGTAGLVAALGVISTRRKRRSPGRRRTDRP